MVANVETSVWKRLVEHPWDNLSPEAAEGVLRIKFKQSDTDRMNELAAIARDGALTETQQAELDAYIQVGRVISILQAKARMAMAKPPGR
jgi:hypothetical protein